MPRLYLVHRGFGSFIFLTLHQFLSLSTNLSKHFVFQQLQSHNTIPQADLPFL